MAKIAVPHEEIRVNIVEAIEKCSNRINLIMRVVHHGEGDFFDVWSRRFKGINVAILRGFARFIVCGTVGERTSRRPVIVDRIRLQT